MKHLSLILLWFVFGCEPTPEIGTTTSYAGTPGCPDCDDPCELSDTEDELLIFGHPVDVDPPITAVYARLRSATQSCTRSVDPEIVTLVPSETDWNTSAKPSCGITSPTEAEIAIDTQSGRTTLICRIE